MVIAGVAVVSAAAWFGVAGRKAVAPTPPRNILLITLDTTRADLLGCYGNSRVRTPNLDRLATGGTLFWRAYTCSPLTLPSHASLLTSMYPTAHGIHYNGTHVLKPSAVTLAEILTDAGFYCGGVMGAYVLHSQFGLNQGFAEYLDRFSADAGGQAERRADLVTDLAIGFLERNADRRFFLWVHYYDPHEPYVPPPPYDALYRGREYEGELASMDAQIGRLLAALEASGHDDDTLIVAVADHGESLMALEGRQGHGMFIYEETMRIPLLMRHSGSVPVGTRVDDVVGIVDVMPTILELAGVEHGSSLHGSSLAPLLRGEADGFGERALYLETYGPEAVFGWSRLLGVIRGDWKYIQAPRPELYALGADPRERTNLVDHRADQARSMLASLETIIAATSTGGTEALATMDPETRRRLESLGYLASVDSSSTALDPKDMVNAAAVHQRASKLAQTNPGAALTAFTLILSKDADNVAAHAEAGKILMNQGSFSPAIDHFQKVAALRTDAVQTYRLLAFCQFQAGRLNEALVSIDKSLAVNPRSNQGMFIRSLVLDAQGRIEEAIDQAIDALNADPGYDAARLHLGRVLSKAGRNQEAIVHLDAIPPGSSARFAACEWMARILITTGRTAQFQAIQTELRQLAASGAPRSPVIAIAGGGY